MPPSPPRTRPPGQLRIIAGRWRGTKLPVRDRPGLRPTPDRLRETLFNWLMPVIDGARALDLYAGTGALGLEALSRGASSVLFVERDREVARALRQTLTRLEADAAGAELIEADTLQLLRQPPRLNATLAFVDPPFAAALWQPTLDALAAGGWLLPGAQVYVESPVDCALSLPDGWTLLRETRAGASLGRLLRAAA